MSELRYLITQIADLADHPSLSPQEKADILGKLDELTDGRSIQLDDFYMLSVEVVAKIYGPEPGAG